LTAVPIPDRLPIIPDAILRQHKVHEPIDTRFRAAARLLQALWRERHDLPMGYYVSARGRRKPLGSRLNALASAAGGNFLDPALQRLARRELAYREPGALIDEARVWSNLLSSMPLTFNLFGALKLDRRLANAVCQALWPDLVSEVCHIQFEHSPARGDLRFTGDATAFDVFISARDATGAKTFVAVEMKYSESMTEPEARLRPRYEELAQTCGLYRDAADAQLRASPLQQLWREHMLAQTLLSAQLFDRGTFVCVAPRLNAPVQRACAMYAARLAEREQACGFASIELEALVEAVGTAGAEDLGEQLHERYCDFAPVHALI
jgi:hypothetical protein